MDELKTLTGLLAERCGLEEDYMRELLELYRRTANRIEAMTAVATVQQKEPVRCEDAAEPEAAREKRVLTFTKPTGAGAKEKQEILARLQAARDDGVSLADISEASGVTISDIVDALNCNKVAMEKWRWIRAGLTKLER